MSCAENYTNKMHMSHSQSQERHLLKCKQGQLIHFFKSTELTHPLQYQQKSFLWHLHNIKCMAVVWTYWTLLSMCSRPQNIQANPNLENATCVMCQVSTFQFPLMYSTPTHTGVRSNSLPIKIKKRKNVNALNLVNVPLKVIFSYTSGQLSAWLPFLELHVPLHLCLCNGNWITSSVIVSTSFSF